MIETLPEARTTAELPLPEAVVAGFASFSEGVVEQGGLVWGEHCQECAYPSCYAACAFYTPRSDFNCRRFAAGFEPLSGRRSLIRVIFRKWGKLEARGPSALRPTRSIRRIERRDERISRLLGAPALPFAVRRSLAARWNLHKGRSGEGRAPAGDAFFVVEGWMPDGAERAFTLTILNEAESFGVGAAGLFQTRFTLGADYRRLQTPQAAIAAQVDLSRPHLVQIEPVGEAEGITAVFGLCDFVRLGGSGSTPKTQGVAKVLVWDLDETLWEGVLAEDGLLGVTLRPEAERAVRLLDERGVLQSIASKNDREEALEALRRFGLEDLFLHPQIHYGPKSVSLAKQAALFGLGLESFVFIDDQPFERAEVLSAHPEVRTLSRDAVATLPTHPWFALPTTPESRRRRRLYQEEALRSLAHGAVGGDYEAFLRASALRLDISPIGAADAQRVFELAQRTNQLNFNGRRLSLAEAQALAAVDPPAGFVLRCQDRFGDYGLIGFALTDLAAGRLDEFFMSCRVQRNRVENAFFDWLRLSAAARGADGLVVVHTPTSRNQAAAELLFSLGFAEVEGRWRRNLDPFPSADVVAVTAMARSKAA